MLGEEDTSTRLHWLNLSSEHLAMFLKFASYSTVQILHYLYENQILVLVSFLKGNS